MRLQNPFAGVSPSGLDSQVLAVLARSEQHLSVHQIHGLLPELGSSAGVRKSVARFVEQGTVVERTSGRSLTYALNDEHVLADPIRAIASARRRLLAKMGDELEAWPVPPLTAVLFGSAARGQMRSDSDIDLLLVMGDEAEEDLVDDLIQSFAARVSRWSGNDLRPLVYRASEVAPAPIFTHVLEDGVEIAGDAAWLRRRLRRSGAAA